MLTEVAQCDPQLWLRNQQQLCCQQLPETQHGRIYFMITSKICQQNPEHYYKDKPPPTVVLLPKSNDCVQSEYLPNYSFSFKVTCQQPEVRSLRIFAPACSVLLVVTHKHTG